MKVVMAEHLGFCMGVRKAIEAVYNIIDEKPGEKVSTFGPLIHNPLVMQDLAEKGVTIIEDPGKAEGTVIIRAHGIHPETRAALEKRDITLIDATCPRVLKSQKTVNKASEKGKYIIIAGDKGHGEVQGIAGYADKFVIIGSREEAEKIEIKMPALLISQTTFSSAEYNAISEILKNRYSELEIANSICPATGKRQEALTRLSEKADAIIVIGGKNSANTRRLFETALMLGKKAWHIENADEIPEEIRNFSVVGITAGASTPDSEIKKVADKLKLY